MSKRDSAKQWSDGAAGPVLRLVNKTGPATWRDFAACLGADTAAFFPDKGDYTQYVRQVCARCPVRLQCLEDAMEWDSGQTGGPYGLAGGMSPKERVALRKQREKEVA